ncbi:MAG TPA: NADH-quinone oxidoreductase subunit NuoI [Thermomicrobiales bacterium]|nr:NADH-quinone oxidoreductase subunit NuoI [Thermomicrobiales bacterium]
MASVIEDLGAFVKGFRTTIGHIFKKPVTIQYPEATKPMAPRFRGRHMLMRYDNGLERCIGCSLCAVVCPAEAIYVEAAENSDAARYSPGERYARRYEINMIRCIFCGYCQEACPVEAIVLGHEYAFSSYTRDGMIYTKEMLLVPDPRQAGAAAD